MKKQSHITLADIAGRLGVSRVTVSKALRGHPDISDAMSKKIRRVASELGYSPNRMARNLSARRSHLLGLVVPKIAHFFFGSVIESVYAKALEHKYETILMVSHENEEQEIQHLQTLVSMRVDGIIISVSARLKDTKIFDWVRQMGIPLLFMDRIPEPQPKGSVAVLVDDYGGSVKAVEQAMAAGHTSIACIGGDLNVNIGRNRVQGYTDALTRHGLAVNRDWIIPGGYGTDVGYQGFMRLLESGTMPSCIFTVTYPIALGVYAAAKARNIRIPDDVDLICFGDSDVGGLLTPALSCVNQPTQRLGEESVKLIMDLIDHPDSIAPGNRILPTDVIVRETCVPRTGKSLSAMLGAAGKA